jgi:hypothetical protein
LKKLLLAAVAAAALGAPAAALAQDEDWTINAAFDSMGIKYAVDCKLADADGKLSGPCTTDQGAVTATGTNDGKAFELAYDTTYQGSPVHLDYKGAVGPDGSVSGTVDTGGPQGTFTAAKK